MNDRVIGIVGGMGPEAGGALFDQILSRTNARMDQEHFSVVLVSFPGRLSDRTAFLEGQKLENPAFEIIKIIQQMQELGVTVTGISCNTCHASEIYNVIQRGLDEIKCKIKLLHMPLEVCYDIQLRFPDLRRIGVMSSNGTYRSGVYRDILERHGYEVVVPNPQFQNDVIHKMIYDPNFGLKANPRRVTKQVRDLWRSTIWFFEESNVDAVILGCTELSLVRRRVKVNNLITIDSTEVLARALMREASDYGHVAPVQSDKLPYSSTSPITAK